VLKDVDLLVFPTLMGPPSPYSLTEGRKDLSDFDANLDSTRLTIMSNITGLPAGSAPIGFHNGFPVGIQIVGDAWDEASVFAVMAHLERIGIARIDQCPEFEALV
jgi:aspartyl-tRNA(Asn)/glutamyl-tRNA(Gln) amidotransferase subunit A